MAAKTWLMLLMLGLSASSSKAQLSSASIDAASGQTPGDDNYETPDDLNGDPESGGSCYCPCQQQPTKCPDYPSGNACTCYDIDWYCSYNDQKASDLPPWFRCKKNGGYWYRKLHQGPCPCYLNPVACVQTDPKKRGVKAKFLSYVTPNGIFGKKCAATGYIFTQNGCGSTGGGNDPIITGFDDRKFHFNEIGNYTLLSDGEGFSIETTFVGVPPVVGVMPKETSWTSQVRITNARGDKVTCHLPQILPNTSRVIMTAQAAGAAKATPMTPYDNNIMEFDEMSATAVSSGWPNPYVSGCHVSMPKLDVIVYQVSGWSQATKYESERWSAPYTWLNIDVKLLKALTLPVTGILGSTYPLDLVEKGALNPEADVSKIIKANVATDPDAMHELEASSAAPGNARRLASADLFPLGASMKGVQLPEAGKGCGHAQ